MSIAPISNDNIRVGYISETDGYVKNKTVAEANEYEKLNPETIFVFVNGDGKIVYLTIDGVNQLTSKDLLRADPCNVGPQPCPPPTIKVFGGGGIGAEVNPVVDSQGNLLAADIVNGGFGYKTPPFVTIIDPCKNGSGAVVKAEIKNGVVSKVVVNETGTGYLPPKATSPQYPAILQISEVRVSNPGINYDPSVDELVIEPANGTQLSYTTEPFGKISGVKILKAGNFTELPVIRMKTRTGVNASFIPVFDVIRDPVPVEPVSADIIQIFDLVGLNINGYVDGKAYYGNVYFVNGVKFAGSSVNSGTNIRVFETRAASISGQNVPVARTVRVREDVEAPEVSTDVITAEPDVVEPSTFTTSPAPTTTVDPTPPTPTVDPTPSPAPSPSPSPAPYTPPPSTGGGGGYGY